MILWKPDDEQMREVVRETERRERTPFYRMLSEDSNAIWEYKRRSRVFKDYGFGHLWGFPICCIAAWSADMEADIPGVGHANPGMCRGFLGWDVGVWIPCEDCREVLLRVLPAEAFEAPGCDTCKRALSTAELPPPSFGEENMTKEQRERLLRHRLMLIRESPLCRADSGHCPEGAAIREALREAGPSVGARKELWWKLQDHAGVSS